MEKLIKELLDRKEKPLALHLALACSEYKDISVISDKELAYLLEKYLSLEDIESQIINFDDPFLNIEDDEEE